jgi:hypothetical protein
VPWYDHTVRLFSPESFGGIPLIASATGTPLTTCLSWNRNYVTWFGTQIPQ